MAGIVRLEGCRKAFGELAARIGVQSAGGDSYGLSLSGTRRKIEDKAMLCRREHDRDADDVEAI